MLTGTSIREKGAVSGEQIGGDRVRKGSGMRHNSVEGAEESRDCIVGAAKKRKRLITIISGSQRKRVLFVEEYKHQSYDSNEVRVEDLTKDFEIGSILMDVSRDLLRDQIEQWGGLIWSKAAGRS